MSVLEEMGEETDGAVESVSKMQEKIEALTGVNILTDSGAYKDTYTILQEIGTVWEDMSDIDQAALLELMAGKNRANTLAAILGNMEDLEGAYKDALKAEGSALKENAAYLDSIQGRVDLFTNATQTMWMNFINADVVKFIVDIGTGLIKLVDTVGVLNVALTGLFAGMYAKHQLKKNDIDLLGFIFDVAPEKIKNAPAIQNFASTVKTAFAEAMGGAVQANSLDVLAELANFDDANNVLGDLANIFGDGNVTKDQAKKILDSFDDISDATKEAILNSSLFAASQTGAAAGTNILTASLTKAKAAVIAFGKGLMAFAAAHPIIAGLTVAVIALGAAFGIYKKFGPTHENYIKKLEEETEELKSVQSELKSVNEELETAKSRMDELQAKGTLSFVEEEELNRLKEQTKELERQEEILIAQEKRARNKQIQTALNAAKTDSNLSKTPTNTTIVEQDVATSQFTGKPSYAASSQTVDPFVATSQFTGSTPYAANQQIDTNKYESTLNALKTAKEDLEKAETELASTTYDAESKEYKKLEKAVEKAQGRVDKYNNTIDSMDEAWKTQYGEVGYVENATTEAEKKWNEFYRQHQDYLDQQALINEDYGKSTVLDRVFGDTGTDVAKKFKKEFESAVKSGKDPAEVIENLLANKNYSSAFSGLEKQFGITLDNIKGYFTNTGEFAIDPNFDVTKYTKAISAHSAVITEYQEAIQKLGKGTFTMDDFVALVEKYPDLAKGVDISSNAFYGLSRNLNRAIKSNTKGFIDDLQALRKSLIAAGKSTESIDQLIEAIENMPDDALDDTIAKYGTLVDEIERAKVAQDRLLASMEENPNEGYETRGEALEYIKDALSRGEIGSESNVWNVAKRYGFTYDSAKSINENADALAKFIAVRETWFKQDDDGNYTYEGTENFVESVEKVVKESEAAGTRLSEILKWDYNEETGVFDFDFDNENLEEIISLLSETKELAGLTSEEWMDMMVQIGQYYNIDWSNYDDALDYLDKIATGSSDATTKLKEYGQAMQEYFGEGSKVDLTNRPVVGKVEMQAAGWTDYNDDYSTVYSYANSNADGTVTVTTTPILPDGKVLSPSTLEQYTSDIANGADPAKYEFEVDGKTYTGDDIVLAKHVGQDSIDQANAYAEALHKAQEQYQLLQDPLEIKTTIAKDGLEGLNKIVDLQGSIQTNSQGITVIDTEAFTSALDAAGYTEQQISDLISRVKEYQNVCEITANDPLGLNHTDVSIKTVMSSLDYLGIQWTLTKGELENPAEINITSKDLITTLQEKGWTTQQIAAYLQNLSSSENGLNISIDGQVDLSPEEINQKVAQANTSAEVVMTPNTEAVDGYDPEDKYADVVYNVNRYAVDIFTPPVKYGTVIYQSTMASANGTAHAQGTAYNSGSWGAPQTETSLVGELGPELLVRNGRWTTVGENGAEFTQVKKGDIIFNHKQTESLLKNGYVTSRGRAYASGTAYASGGGTFNRYEFSGEGGYTKYDVNNNVVDKFGNAASSLSGAADDISDAADDAEQMVDFIEMKLEEIEAIIEKTSSRIANFLDDTTSIKSKDELYDELIKAEKAKSDVYVKAAQKYNVEAAAALSGVPQQYQEMARNGAIAIKDFIGEDQVEIAEKIEKYRDLAAKADEAENGHLETIAAISAHRVEQLEDIATDFENIISISQSHSDLLQAEMDFIEESGNRLSESYYEELKKHSQKQLDDMQAERVALQKILDDSVAAGDVIVGSDDWYSMLETIYEVDQEIVDCKTSLEEFQNAINELYWDNFDKLIAEIDNVNSELSNLYDLVSDADDVVDEMGNWTDDGIAALGLLAQQMENAQFKSQQYGEAIAKLKKDYADGLYSTDEYNERLSDLTDSQYSAIKSYENAKDAIVDLNKTRVEAVKDGMQKEIDAYSELIEKKKEALDADRDAYDFQKQVQESTKNIEDIERKIAALEGNTSSSAMAQRKRLEAELLKAREELQDLYYNHSIDKQQEALDKELEGYTQNKQEQMDALDEYLKKEEQVIADSFDLIAENTKSVVDTLIGISEEYGVTISDTVVTPWIEGANAIGTYQEQLDTSVSATTANLETLKQHLEDLQTQADKTAESVVAATHSTIVETNDGHQTSIKGYAKGSKSVEYDQWALIDELGDELQLIPNEHGRLDYIKKGTGILNNTLTERLIDLAVDPTSMLENSRPVIGAPGITTTNNTFAIDASVGTLLHVEHLDGSNPAEVAKLVDKAWEKKMQTLNNSIKKFTR